MSKLTEEQKQLIQQLLAQEVPRKEIAQQVHIRWGKLKEYLDSINAPKIKKGIPLEYYQPIKELYMSGLTAQKIHEHYYSQFSVDQIGYICKQMGVSRPSGKQATLNHNYFESIDTPEKAYWLGLLTADGNVQHCRKNSWSIQLSLMLEDRYLVELFAVAVQTDLQVKNYQNNTGFQRKDGKPHIESRIVLHSEKMANDLSKYGVVPRKSLQLKQIPELPQKYIRDYIRGFFDGNGSITYYSSHNKQKPRLMFYSTHDFCDSIRTTLSSELSVKQHNIIDQKDYNVSYIYYLNQDAISLYHYLYDDATLYMKRKKEKFEELIGKHRDNCIA